MNRGAVPVSVEWALWGMKPGDSEEGVLRCSNGVLAEENFEQVVNRYLPGNLEDLPQVTLGWLPNRGRQDYIAFAIHERQGWIQRDTGDGVTVSVRCFCVPYATLAAGPVSYQAMLDKFRDIRIPTGSRDVIETELPVMTTAAAVDPLAMRVAALMLTCRPVCILGADELSFSERLRFLDAVMSLLPYGLRSQVSVSTMTSSQYWEHKFRLFFSDAERVGDDRVVNWSEDDEPQPDHDDPDVSKYLNWLANVSRLADLTDPIGFHRAQIDNVLDVLFTAPGGPAEPSLADDSLPLPEEQGTQRAIEDLLNDCADKMLDGSMDDVRSAIENLSRYRYDQATAAQRKLYQDIIKTRQLLRQRLPIRGEERSAFYKVMLRLAFESPLTYPDYCQLEHCVGNDPGQPMHRSLLTAVTTTAIRDFCVRLLVLKAIGDEELDAALGDSVPPSLLIGTTADSNLRGDHGRAIYEIAVGHLVEQKDLDVQVLQDVLHQWGYLAATLQRLYPGQFETQKVELCRLLKLAHRGNLDKTVIRQILGDAHLTPTLALYAAVSSIANPNDVEPIERSFMGSTDQMRAQLLAELDGTES